MIEQKLCEWIDQTFYSHYGDRWDDFLFRKEIELFLNLNLVLLDLGAGSGNNQYMNFRGQVAKVAGVDPDPSVLQNPFLDEAKVGKGEMIPYDDDTFDIVISANTLEHLNHPKRCFQEVNRVLKPEGLFFIKTPNKYHYVTFISKLTPISFHRFYNKLRGVNEQDVFPTRYKANDPQKLRHLAQLSGFEVISINLFEGRPEYLRLFWPTYLCGLLFERLLNRFEQLRIFRGVIITKFRKIRRTNNYK
jgi:SAM-dependent methyltransferase